MEHRDLYQEVAKETGVPRDVVKTWTYMLVYGSRYTDETILKAEMVKMIQTLVARVTYPIRNR